ncbi:hypothetical protein [Stenotrophomonas maltophilia]|uniref:hypothetical protein n=1 Tax=Stenotrophomonas maltophilia TaxID=40324 RepID=UPI0021C7B996|nr:hypothetical protein [Stenotrophomonas maltophilia]MCU1064777.1 hypothetical protein [Stenotrophomonas maltophilia]
MDYSKVDFREVSVEHVYRCAADDLYQAAHKVRGEAHLKLQNTPSNVVSEVFEGQVAEAAFDEMRSVRSAYMMLYACENQLRSNVPWASATGNGAFQWSTAGREIVVAIKAIQSAYSKLLDAAMFLSGSEGEDRERYLSLVASPNDPIEEEMVKALLVLKDNP